MGGEIPYENLHRGSMVTSKKEDTTETLWTCIFLLIFSFLPFASIFIGVSNLDHCPAEKYIAIYMLVLGVFAEAYILLSYSYKLPLICGRFFKSVCGIDLFCEKIVQVIRLLCFLFLFSWTIAGTVWIAKVYPPDYFDRRSKEFCAMQLFDSSCAGAVLSYFCLLYITVKYLVNYLSTVYTGEFMVRM